MWRGGSADPKGAVQIPPWFWNIHIHREASPQVFDVLLAIRSYLGLRFNH